VEGRAKKFAEVSATGKKWGVLLAVGNMGDGIAVGT